MTTTNHEIKRLEEKTFTFDETLASDLRQETGAYYTPLFLAQQMTQDALKNILVLKGFNRNQVDAFLNLSLSQDDAKDLVEVTCHLKWLDMACGTGIFAYAYLCLIEGLLNHYSQKSEQALKTVASNMVLSDRNPHVFDMFNTLCDHRFSCRLSFVQVVGDSLLDLEDHVQVTSIIKSGGFDLIIGNPPYVGERGNKALFKPYKSHPKTQAAYEGRMDMFYFFLHMGMRLLSDKGILCQVTTAYFTTADGASKLRAAFKEKMDFISIESLPEQGVFKNVKPLSFLVYHATKQGKGPQMVVLNDSQTTWYLKQEDLYDDHGQVLVRNTQAFDHLIKVLKTKSSQTLGHLCSVNQGVVSGADRINQRLIDMYPDKDLKLGPLFVFEEEECANLCDPMLRPFIKNGQIRAFAVVNKPKRYLLYSVGPDLVNRPDWLNHLLPMKDHLEKRREVVTGRRQWFELQWGREAQVFENPKIVVPQRAVDNRFAYVKDPCYGSADIYFIGKASEAKLKALTVYLNSSLVYVWLYFMGKRKGKQLELYATPLSRIPVPDFKQSDWDQLEMWYTAITEDLGGVTTYMKAVDEWLLAFLGLDAHHLQDIDALKQTP